MEDIEDRTRKQKGSQTWAWDAGGRCDDEGWMGVVSRFKYNNILSIDLGGFATWRVVVVIVNNNNNNSKDRTRDGRRRRRRRRR